MTTAEHLSAAEHLTAATGRAPNESAPDDAGHGDPGRDAPGPDGSVGAGGAAAADRTGPLPFAAGRGVERPITIAVTGTHSTGKTTFLGRLARELRGHDLEVATVADLGEAAQQIGLPILHSHNYASTLWIMTRGLSNEVGTWPHCDLLLVDRPVPDALGYYLAALEYRGERGEPTLLGHLRGLAAAHSIHYDLIFRTELDPDVPLGRGKVRDADGRYRRLTDHHIAAVLHELRIDHETLPTGGHDAAIERAVEFTLTAGITR